MSLATSLLQSTHEEEDYIDIEISCFSPKPKTRDFEFQMFSLSENETVTNPSPADELFYKGKLLPLNFLHAPKTAFEFLKTPPISNTNTNTPLGSCSISPSESCRVSTELNPDECLFDWSNEYNNFLPENQKKPWSKKLKLIKQSLLAQKLKSSKAYIKSLFITKSPSLDIEPEVEEDSKTKECFKKQKRSKGCYPTIASIIAEESVATHRKSFSGVIKRHCATKPSSSTSSSGSSSLSSSFSMNSNGIFELQLLKRSISAISEAESSIEGAIEHCKQSQMVLSSSNNKGSNICSLSVTSNVVFVDKER